MLWYRVMSVKAMRAGAVEFLPKPFRDQDLLDAVRIGIDRDKARRESEGATSNLRGKYGTLTNREQQIIALVASGFLNKQIAAEIGVTEVTVKVHRGNMLRRLIKHVVRATHHFGNPARSRTSTCVSSRLLSVGSYRDA